MNRPEERKSAKELIERYQARAFSSEPRDASFNRVVDMLVAAMIDMRIAPDEIRDAAFVASIKYLHMHPVDVVYVRDDALSTIDNDLKFNQDRDNASGR